MEYLLNPDSNKKRPCKIFLSLVAITTFALGASVFADTNSVVLSADSGPAVSFDVSTPLRDIRPAPIPLDKLKREIPKYPIPNLITNTGGFDPFLQSRIGTEEAPPLLLNFEGVGLGFTGPNGTYDVIYAPSDSNSDVGPNHIVEVVNVALAIFDKAGNVLLGPIPINTIWSGFGGGCESNNDGDPVVKYDKLADRWIISQIIFTKKPYMQCVAVSRTGDPTGAYARYSFLYGNSFDYSKIGVWPDAYYISSNTFKGQRFVGAETCAYDRQSMLNGTAASQQCFQFSSSIASILPSDLDGKTQPPSGSPNYLINLVSNALNLWKFHVDWVHPRNSRITGPTKISVAPFAPACGGGVCIPQSETTQKLDSLGDRLMYRLSYRNFIDHESLVVNHSVAEGKRVGVRWYEIRSPNIGTYVYQQGTFAPDDLYRWMGSIAMDGLGNIGMGYSVSSSNMHPGIRYTGHATTDRLGVMGQGEGTLIAGGGSQTGNNLNRWGDYSSISVDPVDDCTFWYTNQYLANNGSFNWHTRIGSFKMPGCP
ncbi:MAG: hypothetical protein PHY93_17840 [Bacteriovorax sp.]|nr:hypothetical protein [Bacteriovorax sp.]